MERNESEKSEHISITNKYEIRAMLEIRMVLKRRMGRKMLDILMWGVYPECRVDDQRR